MRLTEGKRISNDMRLQMNQISDGSNYPAIATTQELARRYGCGRREVFALRAPETTEGGG